MKAAPKKYKDYLPAMLAKERETPFADEDWIFEIKWDGYRAIAEINNGDVKLYSRNGNAFDAAYPQIVEALQKLKINAIVDGEIVVLNEEGISSFQQLQDYDPNTSQPLYYYVFDLLEYNGKKLLDTPLIERKSLLQKMLPKNNTAIRFSDHVDSDGEKFFGACGKKGLEGMIAKKKESHYYPGKRTGVWLKIKHHKAEEAIIAGFTSPRGSRSKFGALVLGVYVGENFQYIGHTGTGFNEKMLEEVYRKLKPLIRKTSPFKENIKTNMPVTWAKPALVCEIKFTEWTKDGKLRHPVFLRLREDKKPADVNTEYLKSNTEMKKPSVKPDEKKAGATSKKHEKNEGATEKEYNFGSTKVAVTNTSKLFFPKDGITKADVLDYYEMIADTILPYLKDRPQSLFRTPNGIDKPGFFHKDAGEQSPSFVKSIKLHSDSAKKDIDYILCNNAATLLYLANLGCIEINPWHSRVKWLDKPDYMIIDVDPGDKNNFDDVVECSQAVKEVLDHIGADGHCKTSGASGMHVYVPMGKKYDYEQVRNFAHLVCMVAHNHLPKLTTLERRLGKRKKNEVYLDYLQNNRGQTIASVYSLRPRPGAPVSTPLDWKEVKKGISPLDFNMFNIAERLKAKGDMFKGILGKGIDLKKCLSKLEGEEGAGE